MLEVCNWCKCWNIEPPKESCHSCPHWEAYANCLKEERDKAVATLEQHDDDRDKLDVAEWLSHYKKVHSYNCHGCGRHYEIPTHLNTFTCVCGHRCRLRHTGGINPDQAVIDAAITYFGNERSASLAWIAEVVAGQHCLHYTADEIRTMIRQEMDRWQLNKDGWRKK